MGAADIAGWIAPAATMIAAMMTAANLGPKVTGWGFIVFTVGSIAWTTIGIIDGPTSLVVANAFLTVVNLVGIWRWLGREVKYRESADTVAHASAGARAPTVVPAGQIVGQVVNGPGNTLVGHVVEAMVGSSDGRVQTLLVRHGGGVGGLGERIVLLGRGQFELGPEAVTTMLDGDALAALPDAVPA